MISRDKMRRGFESNRELLPFYYYYQCSFFIAVAEIIILVICDLKQLKFKDKTKKKMLAMLVG